MSDTAEFGARGAALAALAGLVQQYVEKLETEMFPFQESEEEQESFTDVGRTRVENVLKQFASALLVAGEVPARSAPQRAVQSGVTIYHGDCREVLEAIGPFDCVVTDPPFGQTSLEWDKPVKGWTKHLTLSACGSLWVFGSLRFFMRLDRSGELRGWSLAQDIIWEKHNGSNFHVDRFRRVHEQAAQFYRGPWGSIYKAPVMTLDATARSVRRKRRPPHTGHIGASAYLSLDGGPRLQRSVLKVRSCHGYAENETEKPVGVLVPLLRYSLRPGGLVCDPFAGSGSLGEAAKALGVQAVLIERRETQCEIAARRIQQPVALEMVMDSAR